MTKQINMAAACASGMKSSEAAVLISIYVFLSNKCRAHSFTGRHNHSSKQNKNVLIRELCAR